MMFPFLNGKNVFITGAGANIGRAIALEAANSGATVYFAEKAEDKMRATETLLREMGALGSGFVCDVSQPRELQDVVNVFDEKGITIDVLVNNVGMHTPPSTGELLEDFESWRLVLDTNILGPLFLTHALTQRMTAANQPGNVVFITSIHQSVVFGDALYSASKAGLSMLVRELAFSLAPQGIRVNGVAPGWVHENDDGTLRAHPGASLHQSAIPPATIARTVLLLASDEFSGWTTGTTVTVDAGLSLYSFAGHRIIQKRQDAARPLPLRAARGLWQRAKKAGEALGKLAPR